LYNWGNEREKQKQKKRKKGGGGGLEGGTRPISWSDNCQFPNKVKGHTV